MALSIKVERRAFLWRVSTRTLPDAANKPTSLDEIVSILEGEFSAGNARVYLQGDGTLLDEGVTPPNLKNQLYIADIKRDGAQGTISILFNRGDPGWVDPALLDPVANEVRVERPTAMEAPGWSAHLVIADKATDGFHRACYEQMTRMPTSLVLAVMDRIVERSLDGNPHYKFEVVKKDKKTKKPTIEHRPYRPVLVVSRSPSENLEQDLLDGRLSGVTLTREMPVDAGIGVDAQVKKVEQQLLITLAKLDANEAQQYLSKLIPQVKDDYSSIQVHIVDLPGGQSSNPTVPLEKEAAMEELYVRAKRLVDFGVLLEQCYETVCDPIKEKMVELIDDDSNWS
jgi:hypothetical protein